MRKRGFIISFLITLSCFAILIFRLFYPYHRHVAVIIYLASWVAFFVPFRKRIMKIKRKRRKSLIAGAILLSLVLLWGLLTLFPVDNWQNRTQYQYSIDDDQAYLEEVLISLENRMEDIENSGLMDAEMGEFGPADIAALKQKFEKIVDHLLILDALVEKYKYFYQINVLNQKELHNQAFLLSYTAYAYKMSTSTRIADQTTSYAEQLMNEKMESGLKNTLVTLKKKASSPETALRMNTGRAYLETLPDSKLKALAADAYESALKNFDASIYSSMDTVLDALEDNTMDTWLPIQKNIANALGETKLSHRDGYLLSDAQRQKIKSRLEPGDLMFQRRNWYASNVGMPGFWTHVAIYVGTLYELDGYFEEEAQAEFGMNVSEYLKQEFPEAYERKMEDPNLITLEGKSVGITMLSLSETAGTDYIAIVRPELDKRAKLLAIIDAFGYYGRPYDYDFDFASEDVLVCSELIYKSYLPAEEKAGLHYDLGMVAGRYMVAPNDMVRAFDQNFGTEKEQNTLVLFFDGNESEGAAIEKGVDEFRQSWKRPKTAFFLD